MPTNICFAALRRVTRSAVIKDAYLRVRRPLRQPLPHLNDSAQSLSQVVGLVRDQPVLVQQCQDAVDNGVLGLSQRVRLREGGFRNASTGILAAKLSNDLVEVLLRAEALSFEYFHNGGELQLHRKVSRSYSWPRTQCTIAAATKKRSRLDTLMVAIRVETDGMGSFTAPFTVVA